VFTFELLNFQAKRIQLSTPDIRTMSISSFYSLVKAFRSSDSGVLGSYSISWFKTVDVVFHNWWFSLSTAERNILVSSFYPFGETPLKNIGTKLTAEIFPVTHSSSKSLFVIPTISDSTSLRFASSNNNLIDAIAVVQTLLSSTAHSYSKGFNKNLTFEIPPIWGSNLPRLTPKAVITLSSSSNNSET